MPTIFISHGPPAIALMETPAAVFLRTLGVRLPRPVAIVCVSAHWEAWRPLVTAGLSPDTIHDFGGPPALFRLRYPAPGSPETAAVVLDLLAKNGFEAAPDPDRGLDHGAWIPLMMTYPDADIPVVQVSVQTELDAAWHYRLGEALSPLRERGVLVVGSGGAVHNLAEIGGYGVDAEPADYAARFDRWLEAAVAGGDVESLLAYKERGARSRTMPPVSGGTFSALFCRHGRRPRRQGTGAEPWVHVWNPFHGCVPVGIVGIGHEA